MKKRFLKILPLVVLLLAVFSGCAHKTEGAVLSNSSASEAAVSLYEYIVSLNGKAVLSGQQESTWMGSADYETDYIFEKTGRYPAIKGFDYMNDDFAGVNERAVQWHKKGGIVTICWHCGSDFSGEWNDSRFSVVYDWEKMLTEGTEEYKAMLDGMDKAAKALKELCDMDIPVLWRPFHEFDGNWFWWSTGGPENFKKMWQIMYRRYTDYWKLDNLIWVLGFSDQGEKSKQWYVGDEYCDIIGADTYNIELNNELYKKMKGITKAPKPLCLHECGTNPTAAELEKTPWSWFMTWHTEYLTDTNTDDALNGLYNSEFILTLDEIT